MVCRRGWPALAIAAVKAVSPYDRLRHENLSRPAHWTLLLTSNSATFPPSITSADVRTGPSDVVHNLDRHLVKRFSLTHPDLSIVIPAYNEAHRLPSYLDRIVTYLEGRRLSYEVLVVDDGSRDDTAQRVYASAQHHPYLRLLRQDRNSGKGAAIRLGMRAAQGQLQLFADADGATAIEELPRLEAAIARGAHIAIGSRTLASRDPRYAVFARWHRSVLGSLFNTVVQRLGLSGIQDTQCGFKLFRHSVAHDLFSVAQVNGYGLDLELLYLARRRGYRIAEVPVNWSDQAGSKVHPLRDGAVMLYELLTVRRRNAQGLYKWNPSQSVAPDPLVNPMEWHPLR